MLQALINSGGATSPSAATGIQQRASKTSHGARLVNTRLLVDAQQQQQQMMQQSLKPDRRHHQDNKTATFSLPSSLAKQETIQSSTMAPPTPSLDQERSRRKRPGKPRKFLPTTTLFDMERESRRREMSTTLGRNSISRSSSRSSSRSKSSRKHSRRNKSLNFSRRLEHEDRIVAENCRIATKLVNVKPMVPSSEQIYRRAFEWDRIRKNLASGTKNQPFRDFPGLPSSPRQKQSTVTTRQSKSRSRSNSRSKRLKSEMLVMHGKVGGTGGEKLYPQPCRTTQNSNGTSPIKFGADTLAVSQQQRRRPSYLEPRRPDYGSLARKYEALDRKLFSRNSRQRVENATARLQGQRLSELVEMTDNPNQLNNNAGFITLEAYMKRPKKISLRKLSTPLEYHKAAAAMIGTGKLDDLQDEVGHDTYQNPAAAEEQQANSIMNQQHVAEEEQQQQPMPMVMVPFKKIKPLTLGKVRRKKRRVIVALQTHQLGELHDPQIQKRSTSVRHRTTARQQQLVQIGRAAQAAAERSAHKRSNSRPLRAYHDQRAKFLSPPGDRRFTAFQFGGQSAIPPSPQSSSQEPPMMNSATLEAAASWANQSPIKDCTSTNFAASQQSQLKAQDQGIKQPQPQTSDKGEGEAGSVGVQGGKAVAAEYVPLLRLTQDSSTKLPFAVNNEAAAGGAATNKTDGVVLEEEAKSTARIPGGAEQASEQTWMAAPADMYSSTEQKNGQTVSLQGSSLLCEQEEDSLFVGNSLAQTVDRRQVKAETMQLESSEEAGCAGAATMDMRQRRTVKITKDTFHGLADELFAPSLTQRTGEGASQETLQLGGSKPGAGVATYNIQELPASPTKSQRRQTQVLTKEATFIAKNSPMILTQDEAENLEEVDQDAELTDSVQRAPASDELRAEDAEEQSREDNDFFNPEMTVKNAQKGNLKLGILEVGPPKSFDETQTPVMGKTVKILENEHDEIAIAQTPLLDKTMKVGKAGGGSLLLKEEEAMDQSFTTSARRSRFDTQKTMKPGEMLGHINQRQDSNRSSQKTEKSVAAEPLHDLTESQPELRVGVSVDEQEEQEEQGATGTAQV